MMIFGREESEKEGGGREGKREGKGQGQRNIRFLVLK
jgi:hypothetical protein